MNSPPLFLLCMQVDRESPLAKKGRFWHLEVKPHTLKWDVGRAWAHTVTAMHGSKGRTQRSPSLDLNRQ